MQYIYIYLKTSINSQEFNIAEQNIQTFVKNFEELYGSINMTYNVHLLSHIPDCVLQLGPLWAYSNFHFEGNNGKLKNYAKGTSDASSQIITKYIFSKSIENAIFDANEITNDFHHRVYSSRLQVNFSDIMPLGASKTCELNENERLLFQQKYGIKITVIESFSRVNCKNKILCTNLYSTNFKNDDSAVLLQNEKYGIINKILRYETHFYFIIEEFTIISKNICNMAKYCTYLNVVNNNHQIATSVVNYII